MNIVDVMDIVVANLLEQGQLNLLASFGRSFFYALLSYYFMSKVLPNRLNYYSLIALSLVYPLWYNLRTPALLGTPYHLGMNIFINAWTFFILGFFFRGKFWQNLIVYWYFDNIIGMCEAIAYVPILLSYAYRGIHVEWTGMVSSVESNPMLNFIYMFAFFALFLLLGFLSLQLWRRLLLQKFQPFYLLMIALPMGQTYTLDRVIHPNMGDLFFGVLINFIADVTTIYTILSIFGIAVCLAADIAILYYVLSHDKREAIEAELRETKHAMELEQTRYRAVELRSEELAKIRHDLNNQLTSIIQLVRTGEDGTARKIVATLTNEINQA